MTLESCTLQHTTLSFYAIDTLYNNNYLMLYQTGNAATQHARDKKQRGQNIVLQNLPTARNVSIKCFKFTACLNI